MRPGSMSVRRHLTVPAAALALITACSSPQAAATAAPATASPTLAASASPSRSPLPAGALRFAILTARSVATIRVNEVIAAVQVPGEAVVKTTAFTGSLVLLADGTFASGSLIAADLDALKSDNDLRDEWIKFNTLNTRIYPRAEFTPSRVTGIPLPLAATGTWTGTIEGTMKIHGVEKELSWPVTVTRAAGEIRTQGKTSFKFGDYGMDVPANRLILSVVDDVRLEIDVVAQDD
jgi:polyisoprenoid-binding protein YceI